MIDFKVKLAENLALHNSFTQIFSNELLRLDEMLLEIANKNQLKIKEWNIFEGFVCFDEKTKIDELSSELYSGDPCEFNIVRLGELSLPEYQQCLIKIDLNGVLDNYQAILEHKLQKLIYRIEKFESTIHVVLVSSKSDIFASLKSSVDFLEMPLLSKLEIHDLIDKKGIILSENKRAELIDVCSGLSRKQIEKILTKFDKNYGDISEILLDKKDFLSKQGLLEVIDSRQSRADIGGLDILQSWLQRKNLIFKKLQDSHFGGRVEQPKGVLIVGMPGCGKSLTAKATANIFNMPLLKLDMGRLMGKYVGDSENNLRQALDIANRSEPCILWIDEIEKGFAGIGGDQTGVSSRLFGYFLTWLQENKSRVFVVATANDITQLPPELLRKGRFDELFFVDFPNKSERKSILKIKAKYYQGFIQNTLNLDRLVQLTDGYSGADIDAIFKQAVEESIIDDKKVDLSQLEFIITQTKSMKDSLGEKLKDYEEKIKKFQLKPASLTDKEQEQRLQSYGKLSLNEKRQESLKNNISDEMIENLANETDVVIVKNILNKENCPPELLNRTLTEHLNRKLSANRFSGKNYGNDVIILDNSLLKIMCQNRHSSADIVIRIYEIGGFNKKELLEILAVRQDIDCFSKIINQEKATPSKDLEVIDELLVNVWQVVARGQKVCSAGGKRYGLGENYPDYMLVTDIVAKKGRSLHKDEALFHYVSIK